jgi:hypothetical protein
MQHILKMLKLTKFYHQSKTQSARPFHLSLTVSDVLQCVTYYVQLRPVIIFVKDLQQVSNLNRQIMLIVSFSLQHKQMHRANRF